MKNILHFQPWLRSRCRSCNETKVFSLIGITTTLGVGVRVRFLSDSDSEDEIGSFFTSKF